MCDKLVHGSPVRWNNCVALACIGVFLFYPCIKFLNVSRRIITILPLSHYRRVCVLSYYYSQWIFLSSTICISGASCAVLCHPISLQVSGPRVTPIAKKVLSL